jgi:hypothetical protein
MDFVKLYFWNPEFWPVKMNRGNGSTIKTWDTNTVLVPVQYSTVHANRPVKRKWQVLTVRNC